MSGHTWTSSEARAAQAIGEKRKRAGRPYRTATLTPIDPVHVRRYLSWFRLDIGNAIRDRRLELNVRQDELARAAGVHKATVNRVEIAAGRMPRMDVLARLALALDMTLRDLL
jgi:DNA-binding XRE family transcriptional regulator